MYDYRAGLSKLFGKNFDGFTVRSLHATADVRGDTATVTLSGSGTYQSSGTAATWKLTNNCLTENSTAPDIITFSTCGEAGTGVPLLGAVPFANGIASPPIVTVRVDGRWYVSAVSTVLAEVDRSLKHFDRRYINLLAGDFSNVTADATITLDKATTVPNSGIHVYSFEGHAGQRVVGSTPITSTPNGIFSFVFANLYGPDGKRVPNGDSVFAYQPVTLPKTGAYKLVLTGTNPPPPATFTLWDAAHAPKSALQEPTFGNGMCTGDCSITQIPPGSGPNIPLPPGSTLSSGASVGTYVPAPPGNTNSASTVPTP
jgi:hypothetical protein